MIGYGTLKKLILTIQPFKPLIHFDSETSMLSFTCFYNDMFGRNTLYHIVTGPHRAWHTHGQFLCIAKIGTLKPIILIRILTANCGGSGGYLSTHFSCMIKWQQTRSLLDRINPHTSVTDYTYLWWLPRNKIFSPNVSMSAFFILEVPHSMRKSYFLEPLTNTTLYLQCSPMGLLSMTTMNHCHSSHFIYTSHLHDVIQAKQSPPSKAMTNGIIWGLCCQKQVSQAGISNYIPQFTVGCNYLSLHEIPASGNKFLIWPHNEISVAITDTRK